MADHEKTLKSADALAAMAGGADLDHNHELDPDEIAEIIGDATSTIIPATFDKPPAYPANTAQATKATAVTQYKRLLVPMLLIVGGLLIVIGIFAFVLSGQTNLSDTDSEQGIVYGPETKWFGMICAPIGLILIIGAWIIKMELSRLDKKK